MNTERTYNFFTGIKIIAIIVSVLTSIYMTVTFLNIYDLEGISDSQVLWLLVPGLVVGLLSTIPCKGIFAVAVMFWGVFKFGVITAVQGFVLMFVDDDFGAGFIAMGIFLAIGLMIIMFSILFLIALLGLPIIPNLVYIIYDRFFA